jgi:hypothetical protein
MVLLLFHCRARFAVYRSSSVTGSFRDAAFRLRFSRESLDAGHFRHRHASIWPKKVASSKNRGDSMPLGLIDNVSSKLKRTTIRDLSTAWRRESRRQAVVSSRENSASRPVYWLPFPRLLYASPASPNPSKASALGSGTVPLRDVIFPNWPDSDAVIPPSGPT